jgi:hypothetical protein
MTEYQKQIAERTDAIKHLLTHTPMSYLEVSLQLGCSPVTVYATARRYGLRRQADKAVSNG